MAGHVSDALRRGDVLAACLALVLRTTAPDVPDDARASLLGLLEWLRSPEITSGLMWEQDLLVPATNDWHDADVIACENQGIWLAHRSASPDADPDIEIREANANRFGRGDLLFAVPLSELLFRVLLRSELFRNQLRCTLRQPPTECVVFPNRVVPGFTSSWGVVAAGPGWIFDGRHFLVDDLVPFLTKMSGTGEGWERAVEEVWFTPIVELPDKSEPNYEEMITGWGYRDLGGWRARTTWVPLTT